jgi:hypothetical protein
VVCDEDPVLVEARRQYVDQFASIMVYDPVVIKFVPDEASASVA